jgi:hypothetical protein
MGKFEYQLMKLNLKINDLHPLLVFGQLDKAVVVY